MTGSELVISPSSISNLEHLETLLIFDCQITWTKNVPIRARRLRYLYFDFEANFCIEIHVSNELEVIFMNNFKSSFNVKHLSELKGVRELHLLGFKVPKVVEETVQFVANSSRIKVVYIQIRTEEQLLSPERWTQLLGQLFTSQVQSLVLYGGSAKLPEYDCGFLTRLFVLDFFRHNFREDPAGLLEKLPCLEKLLIYSCEFVGKEMVCHSRGFPQLRILYLFALDNLEQWIVETGAMPSLSFLRISDCNDLKTIPEGLRSVTALKRVEIEKMPREFEEEMLNNFGHVPSISFV